MVELNIATSEEIAKGMNSTIINNTITKYYDRKWVSVDSLLLNKIVWNSDNKYKPTEWVILLTEEQIKELEDLI